MEIKLKRALWQHKKGDTMQVNDNKAKWAINKGLAVKIDKVKRKKKIDPKAEEIKNE